MSEIIELDPRLAKRLIKGSRKGKGHTWTLKPKPLQLYTLLAAMQEAARRTDVKTLRVGDCSFDPAATAAALEKYSAAIGDGNDLTKLDAADAGAAYGAFYAPFGTCTFVVPLQIVPIPRAILREAELCQEFSKEALKEIERLANRSVAMNCAVQFTQWGMWDSRNTHNMPEDYKICFDGLYGGDTPEAEVLLARPDEDAATAIDIGRRLKPVSKTQWLFQDDPESIEDIVAVSNALHNQGVTVFYQGKNRVSVASMIPALKDMEGYGKTMALEAMKIDPRADAATQAGKAYARVVWEFGMICWPVLPFVEKALSFFERTRDDKCEDVALRCAFILGFCKMLKTLSISGPDDPRLQFDRDAALETIRGNFLK